MKTRFTVKITLLFVLAALVAACSGGPPAAPPTPTPVGDATAGKIKFEGTCTACHGPDGKGVAGLGKDLTTSEFAQTRTDAELVAFLKTGRPVSDPANTTGVDMPPKGGNPALTEIDLEDVVAYIRSLQQ